LGKFEQHFVLEIAALVLQNFRVDFVFVPFLVDGPVDVLELTNGLWAGSTLQDHLVLSKLHNNELEVFV